MPLLLEKRRFERAVVAGVAPNRQIGDVPRRFADAVQKLAVVRDHQHGRRLALQPRFEPDDRIQVEVIGRLVEQQQIGRTQERARQRQSIAPSAGERAHRTRAVGFCETEAVQHRLSRRGDRTFVQIRQHGVRVREPHRVVLSFGRRQLGARGGQRRVATEHVRDRSFVGRLDVLRDVRDALERRRLDRSAVDRQLAENRSEQRRLARAVGADQPDPLTRRRDQRNVAIQRARAARKREID